MSADLSVQNLNGHAFRMANALLRATGGTVAALQMPPAAGDTSDAGQLGINAPNFQSLPLSPCVFRRVRPTVAEGQPAKYELVVSALAVGAAVGELELSSADLLFQMAAGVIMGEKLFLIEAASVAECMGAVYLYRLQLRESASEWQLQDPQ
jgi:hypothetical protein